MRKIPYGLMASLMLLPVISFGQTVPQAPAAWIAFQKQENIKRTAFFEEMKADREAFLRANPDVKAYFDEMHATAKERRAEWKAMHHK
jgi:hypothetical protein